MNHFKNFICKFLKWIDIYDLPILIKYKNKRTYSTTISIFFSIVLYLVLIITIYTQIGSLIVHDSPLVTIFSDTPLQKAMDFTILNSNITSYNNFLIINDDGNLKGNSSFLFGYAIYDTNSNKYVEINDKYFSVTITHSINSYLPNGSMVKTRIPIQSTSCINKLKNISDFQTVLTQNYWPNDINKFQCPLYDFSVVGNFVGSDYFKYIAMKAIKCNKNCESKEKFDEFIRNKVVVFMNIRLDFEPKKFRNPYLFTFETKTFSLSDQFTKKVDIFLKREIIYSFDSIFPKFDFLQVKPESYSYIKVSEIKEYPSLFLSNELLSLNLRAAFQYSQIRRYYRDLFKVCGLICGLYKFVHLIIYYLITRINRFYQNVEICNEMFNLIDPELDDNVRNNPLIKDSDKRKNLYGVIDTLKDEPNFNFLNNDLNEIVLWEAFRFENNGIIEFSLGEVFLYYFGIISKKTETKLNLVSYATRNIKKFKDIKVLYEFTKNFKEFLVFALGSNCQSKIFIITQLMNKSKFYSKNVENFQLMKNIISFVQDKNETIKDIENREILRNTLNKYRGIKMNSITYIDKRLLELLPVDPRIMEEFIRTLDY